ncbi:MAG: hypothetical protein ACOZIN_17950 [Myxococcota bacterium]
MTRQELQRAQAALVDSLVAGGPVSLGLDAARVKATERMLLRKRAREARQAWPRLAAFLGAGFASRFSAWAAAHPPPALGGPLADGRAFIDSLSANAWPGSVAAELLEVDMRWKRARGGLLPRGRWALAFRRVGNRRVLAVALGRWERRLTL